MNMLLSLLVIIFIALAAAGVAVLVWVIVWKSWRAGQVSVRGLAFDREKQPGTFWLVLAVSAFAATTFACFSIFLFRIILEYGFR